jgi:hypothetical protein
MTAFGFTVLGLIVLAAPVSAQTSTNQTLVDPRPSDARMNQFEEVRGSSWKVFAVESFVDGPLGITEVQELRQQNPPSKWAVIVRNRSLFPVERYTMAAAIVTGDGHVKAVQPLPTIRNLGPSKIARQEMRVITTVLMPTDRVVFFVKEISSEVGQWKAPDSTVFDIIKAAARQIPVP